MKSKVLSKFQLGLTLWFISWSQGFGYVTDNSVQRPLDYYTFLPPAVGRSYLDPSFGTEIRRISDARNQFDAAAGSGNLTFITNEYASMSAFNSDNSLLLLQHQSYFALHDGQGNHLRDLPFEINASSEPRWSRLDPQVIYYVFGNQLRQYHAATGSIAVVRTFGEYSRITGKGESDICFEGDHFVLVGDNRDIFVYQISTDAKGPVFNTAGLGGFDQVYITPSDNVIVGWYQIGYNRFNGVELYDRNMKYLRQLAPAIGHMDVTRDTTGEEVLVWVNAADPAPVCNNGVVKIRLSDGQQTCLLSLDWSLAIHISGTDNNGWVTVGTYAPSDPNPLLLWPPYTNELLQVKLDGAEVRRSAHHRSRPFNGYTYTPRASVSRDGSRVVYSSNYSLQSILGYPSEYSDVYLIQLSGSATITPPPSIDATPPVVGMSSPTSDSTVSGTITVSASASDNEGVAGVQFKLDGANLGVEDTSAPYSMSWNTSSVADGSHTLSAVARDAAGNTTTSSAVMVTVSNAAPAPSPSPSLTTTRFEQDSTAVSFTGTWFSNSHSGHSGGSAVLAMDSGSRATFAFSGTSVKWIGYRDEWAGIANVYLDGGLVKTVDTYQSPAAAQAVLFSATALGATSHTLVIEATGTRNTLSGGAWVWVDTFEVESDTTAPSVSIASPPTASTVGGIVTVSADASDNVGVAGVQFKIDGVNLGAEDTTAPYSVSWDTTTVPDGRHVLTAVARDAAGNTAPSALCEVTVSNLPPAPAPVVTRFEENGSSVQYVGAWFANSHAGHSGGTAALSMDAGSQAIVTFNGTGVSWIAYRDEWSGLARLLVDGQPFARVDTYASPSRAQAVMYTITGLHQGTHTLVIEVTGKRKRPSGGAWIWVDAFDVYP